MAFNSLYLRTPSGLLKIAEIVLVLVALILYRSSNTLFSNSRDAHTFGGGTLVMALVITPLLLTCYLMGRTEIQKTIFEVVFNGLMFIFLLALGIVPLVYFSDKIDNTGLNIKSKSSALGSFCIIASLAYLADTVFAVLLYRK